MEELNKTTVMSRGTAIPSCNGLSVTVFDGESVPFTLSLDDLKSNEVSFGRDPGNDIVLESLVVSHFHGRFISYKGKWYMEDNPKSANGLMYNNIKFQVREINDGDIVRIDDSVETVRYGVLFIFSDNNSDNKWKSVDISGIQELTIGRDTGCMINLPHISVSKLHARIVYEDGCHYIIDNNSTNGVAVNGRRIAGKVRLHEKDLIVITNTKLVFTSGMISYCSVQNGMALDASDIVIRRGKGRKSFITCNHVNLNIQPGELVAIVGGSGAGKSTVLNAMCGYLKPFSGNVYINGVDLYDNFEALKKLVGYVPQSDIVYDNLTLYDMLMYTAKLRLPSDTSKAEMENAINRAIETVNLPDKKNSFIKALSGGQKKRASIAVELLSDPNLLFLDEPASGLDPGTERNLMQSLKEMAKGGKTVILVTHSTLQLDLCDKIVFMGKGGRLCFYGSLSEAKSFFGVDDIVDVYDMITDHSPYWSEQFANTFGYKTVLNKGAKANTSRKPKNRMKQFGVLCARYRKLVFNDRQRLLLLMCQAPILSLLISFVADGQQFTQYEMTKSLLFALSCSAFWIGMLNSIQEICKERSILKREYMTGLSLSSYIMSKITVLGGLCVIQSLMVTGVFGILVGLPEKGVLMLPYLELLVTAFMTALASAAMGLLVSSLFTNADRAMTVAPILLMPQILFSGLIFKLDGATEIISWFALCRWSMESFGTTADLNSLELRLAQEGIPVVHEAEDFFTVSVGHMLSSWGLLLGFTLLFLVGARIVLGGIGKEKS